MNQKQTARFHYRIMRNIETKMTTAKAVESIVIRDINGGNTKRADSHDRASRTVQMLMIMIEAIGIRDTLEVLQ